jgi:uncharacterized protein (TIGR03435 family)
MPTNQTPRRPVQAEAMRTACIFLVLSLARAQSPSFNAVSIKPCPEGAPIQLSGCMGGPGSADPGRIRCEYVTLRALLQRAYKLRASEIFGPSWLDSVHFNVEAKLPAGATKEQEPAMFAGLLSERFHLETHREARPVTAYSLTLAKSGSKLSTAAPPPPGAPKSVRQGDDGFPILPRSSIASGPIILYNQGGQAVAGRFWYTSSHCSARSSESVEASLGATPCTTSRRAARSPRWRHF